jgi:hypothetical protein
MESMSDMGALKLGFTQMMDFGRNKPSNRDIRMIMKTANQGEHEGKFYVYEEGRRLSEFSDEDKFAWTVKEVTDFSLEFKIDFLAPMEISQDSDADKLEIEFISDIFVSKESEKPLQIDASGLSFLDFDIPLQFKSEEEKEAVMAVANTANAFVNANLILIICG